MRLTPSDAREERHRRLSPRRAPIAQPANGRARRRSRTISLRRRRSGRCGRSARPALRPRGARPRVGAARGRPARGDREAGAAGAIHCKLAWATRFKEGFVRALDHARAALRLADELDDDALRVDALIMLGFLGGAVGDPDAPATQHGGRARPPSAGPNDTGGAVDAFELGDIDTARAFLEGEYRARRERDELAAADTLRSLSFVELWGGRWQLAADCAERALRDHRPVRARAPWHHLPLARRRPSRSAGARPRAFGAGAAARRGAVRAASRQSISGRWASSPCRTATCKQAARWFEEAEAVDDEARLARAGPPLVDRRPRRGAARARPARRRRSTPRRVGGGRGAPRTRPGARAGDALPRPRRRRSRATSTRPPRCSRRRSRSTRRRRSLRTGPRAARARRRPPAATPEARRPRRDRARRSTAFEQLGAATWIEKARAELGRIGGRTRAAGADAGRAPRRRARRGGPHEPRGRCRALPERAHGRDPPVARLRQARRALAGRARADASGRTSKVQGDSHDFKLSAPA